MPPSKKRKRFLITLLASFTIIWLWLAIAPLYRFDWFLENILVFIGVPFVLYLHRRIPLSNLSYTLIFLFLVIHSYGTHYTYSETPAGKVVSEWLGYAEDRQERLERGARAPFARGPVRKST